MTGQELIHSSVIIKGPLNLIVFIGLNVADYGWPLSFLA